MACNSLEGGVGGRRLFPGRGCSCSREGEGYWEGRRHKGKESVSRDL
jgi:hypothetical protein